MRPEKGTITDLMSNSQFHCPSCFYLDWHGFIFETSICYLQDQQATQKAVAGLEPVQTRVIPLFN